MAHAGKVYLHIKSNALYLVVLTTVLQTDTQEDVVIYCNEKGQYFARPVAQFDDGRFTLTDIPFEEFPRA